MANERLRELRALMEQHGMDAYYVPSSDFHDSEYVADYFRCRAFLSGFTGSAGTMVVMKDFSGLWTDGRYFVQAKKELEGQETELMRMGQEGVPTIEEFLKEHLPEGGVLGMDGRVVNTKIGRSLEAIAQEKNGSLSGGHDLVGEIWRDRPALEAPDLWILAEQYAGESLAGKVGRLRGEMKKNGATVHVLSGLDDIAWLLNIRKEAPDAQVLAAAHMLITLDSLQLFIDSSRMKEEVAAYFKENGVTVRPYEEIYGAAAALRSEKILLEPGKINFALWKSIDESNTRIEAMNPTSTMKAVKNPVEMENLRKAHVKDGVALTKFIRWMKTEAPVGELTETGADEKLEQFRMQQEGYLCPSFSTISAYGSNAAMCHYHAT